eukprot:TRINITY_DN34098_c0_g1_i1.p1 TRINITY_DN34098_c0_g1~~TRINITY_DN34098_c0_g1_i1.p1  ORF type:complete len:508 (+),score=100.63 TRINITY_DN34098_c0_g1_i1:72-1595(+)
MAIADIDFHDYFDAPTIVQLKRAFSCFDTKKEGNLNTHDLYKMFKKLGKPVSRAQLQAVMEEVDVDGSGEIDFGEMCLLEIKMSGARPRADLIDYHEYLSDRLVRHLEQLFVQIDKGKGVISLESLQHALEAEGVQPSSREYELVYAQVDPEGTDEIDFDQFCASWAILSKARKQVNYREFLKDDDVDEYRKAFKKADRQGKGFLSLKELDKVLVRLGLNLKRPQLKALFSEFDEDGSGGIDFDEFCVMILRLRGSTRIRTINPSTCTCEQLWKDGFTVPELQRSGFKLEDMRRVGVPVGQIYRDGSFSGLELRRAGYSAQELKRGGVPVVELRSCGYSLADLRNAGFSAGALSEVNRKMHSSLSAGDLSILPQRCPFKMPLKKDPQVLSSAGFQIAANSSKEFPPAPQQPSLPKLEPAVRCMTPLIREHTDWRPQLRSVKGTKMKDALATFMEDDEDGQMLFGTTMATTNRSSKAGTKTSVKRIALTHSGFILNENFEMRTTLNNV